MSEGPSSGAPASSECETDCACVSLDDLIALNDEIIALIRAGVPLERGLAGLADDLPGRLGASPPCSPDA